MSRADYMGREDNEGNPVWIIATPHFLNQWDSERFGKSKSVSLSNLLGSWKGGKAGFYTSMLDSPLGTPYYAIVRSKKGKKPCCFIYFRNIKNNKRGDRRELELITVSPPIHGQTQGINLENYHDHLETEMWCELIFKTN